MVLYTKDSGRALIDMDSVYKFGKMGQNMKGIGRTIWLTVMADFGMQMVIFMMEIGNSIGPMVSASILMLMVLSMKGIGQTIGRMDTARRHGLMDLFSMASIRMD